MLCLPPCSWRSRLKIFLNTTGPRASCPQLEALVLADNPGGDSSLVSCPCALGSQELAGRRMQRFSTRLEASPGGFAAATRLALSKQVLRACPSSSALRRCSERQHLGRGWALWGLTAALSLLGGQLMFLTALIWTGNEKFNHWLQGNAPGISCDIVNRKL